jgi:hypothetical protein
VKAARGVNSSARITDVTALDAYRATPIEEHERNHIGLHRGSLRANLKAPDMQHGSLIMGACA